MAEQGNNSTLSKLLNILKYEKAEISSVYFYAILGGLIQLSLPLGIQAIIAFVMGGGISTSIVLLIIAVVMGVFLVGFLRVNQMRIIETIQQQIFVRYSFWYASRIPKLNLSKVDDYYLPEFVNRFFDVQNLQKGMSKLLLDMPAATIQIIFGLMLLSFYSATFIIFGLALVIVLYLLLRLTGNQGLQSSIKESDFKYKAGGYLQELARAVTAFKFSSAASLHIKKTDQYVSGYLDARTEHFKVLKFQYWTLIGFKVLITAAMLSMGALLVIQQELNLGQFVAAEIVIVMIIDSVEKIIINLESVYDVLTSVEKLSKILDKPEESQGTEPLVCHQKGLELKLSNVNFGYQIDKWVLQNINLDIESGEKVSIYGPNSSGKSSLLKLLSGVYKSFSGTYFINNLPIDKYDNESLRAAIGVQLNGQEIFEGTLRENICIGDERITTERIMYLAEIVGLKDFILQEKDGIEVMLKTAGEHLSGIIARKILVMRALVAESSLVLLENPWQNMEDEYVQSIQDYILHKMPNTTVIVVNNDLFFATKCHKIIALDKGKIQSIKVN